MTRDEHLAWAKQRATECVDRGQLADAVSSMAADLNQHPAFQQPIYGSICALGVFAAREGSEAVRRWIEGFN